MLMIKKRLGIRQKKAHVLSDTINKQKENIIDRRTPTYFEILSGVPEWWCVREINGTIVYSSPSGKNFNSIECLVKWRKDGPFEEPDWNNNYF